MPAPMPTLSTTCSPVPLPPSNLYPLQLFMSVQVPEERMRTLLTAVMDGYYLASERSQSLSVEMLVYNGEQQCFGYLNLAFSW